MTHDQFNTFCKALAATSHVVQWGGSHVWKVGDKVFAIGGWADAQPSFTFKVTPLAYEMLKEQAGLRPAPYLASRGMTWIQRIDRRTMDNAALKDYLRESHRLCAAKLTKNQQSELGL